MSCHLDVDNNPNQCVYQCICNVRTNVRVSLLFHNGAHVGRFCDEVKCRKERRANREGSSRFVRILYRPRLVLHESLAGSRRPSRPQRQLRSRTQWSTELLQRCGALRAHRTEREQRAAQRQRRAFAFALSGQFFPPGCQCVAWRRTSLPQKLREGGRICQGKENHFSFEFMSGCC